MILYQVEDLSGVLHELPLDRLFLVELNGNMKDLMVGFEGDMVGQNN